MNIPEMTIDMKQGLRSENAIPVQTVQRANVRNNADQNPGIDGAQRKPETAKQALSPTKEELNDLIAATEKHLEANNVKLKFNVSENNNTIQVEILDSNGKVIRKIPEDDLIKLTKSLKNLGQGFLNEVY